MSLRLVLLGAPGSGKGTQAASIGENYHLFNLSLGKIIRDEIGSGSVLGNSIQEYAASGSLIPDTIVVEIFKSSFRPYIDGGFILDGFPRTVSQAVVLDQLLDVVGQETLQVFYLQVDLVHLMKRLLGRRVCTGCGMLYHTEYSPSKILDVCDVCLGALMTRPDDNELVIRNRFQVFENEINELVEYYGDRLVSVSALDSPANVYNKIIEKFYV